MIPRIDSSGGELPRFLTHQHAAALIRAEVHGVLSIAVKLQLSLGTNQEGIYGA